MEHPSQTKDGIFPETPASIPLFEVQTGLIYQIVRVIERSNDMMEYITENQLMLNSFIYLDKRIDIQNSVEIISDSKTLMLSEFIAGSIMVRPRRTLFDLMPDEKGIVQHILGESYQKRRLMELGFVEGTSVWKVMDAPSGDPSSYLVRGTTIAMRKEEAQRIILIEE